MQPFRAFHSFSSLLSNFHGTIFLKQYYFFACLLLSTFLLMKFPIAFIIAFCFIFLLGDTGTVIVAYVYQGFSMPFYNCL